MDASKVEMFRNRLTKVYRHISRQAKRRQVTCFRIYDNDIPEFPLCIEQYEDKVYAAEYARRHHLSDDEYDEWLEVSVEIISAVVGVPIEHIFLRRRQRKTGRQGQYQRISTGQQIQVVHENGLQFEINLSDYLDTGLFLDHRITRQMVREEAAGKRVLNLFCYTGSFSVYAAAGNAARVVSVDLSNTYLKWATENFKLNGLQDERNYEFIKADVKEFVKTLRPSSFDLVIMDPPTFSNSKMMKDILDIQRDHADLLNAVLHASSEGGVIYFSTNYRKFTLNSRSITASGIRDITAATTPFDFQGKLHRYCYRITR